MKQGDNIFEKWNYINYMLSLVSTSGKLAC